MTTKDIRHDVVAKIGDVEIIRSEARQYDPMTGEITGRTLVYYDVCYDDDLLDSFKTLAKAKAYAKIVIQ